MVARQWTVRSTFSGQKMVKAAYWI